MRLPISTDELRNVVESLAYQKEKMILEQLGDLVSKGFLVIEQGPLRLAQLQHKDELMVVQDVKLVLKDQEYIKELEEKVAKQSSAIVDMATEFSKEMNKKK